MDSIPRNRGRISRNGERSWNGENSLEWGRNLQLKRLSGPGAFVPTTLAQIKTYLTSPHDDEVHFAIRLLESQELIGHLGLKDISLNNQSAELFVRIGSPEHWGRGYGTEAIEILLRYSFLEMNLHRIQLGVTSYNTRAIELYRRLGFRHEGTLRDFGYRDRQRYNFELYSLLFSEWEQRQISS